MSNFRESLAKLQVILHISSSKMSDPKETTSHDIVIVGGGTAGSVFANRLSEDRHITVVVIKAATDQSQDVLVRAPGASASLIRNPVYD